MKDGFYDTTLVICCFENKHMEKGTIPESNEKSKQVLIADQVY
jgi:hypothetical protein